MGSQSLKSVHGFKAKLTFLPQAMALQSGGLDAAVSALAAVEMPAVPGFDWAKTGCVWASG